MAETPELEVRRATIAERGALLRMLELYQYELSDIWDQDLDADGLYGYGVDRYWSDPSCHPYIALVASRHAGFALVDGNVKVGASGQWMDQFFVLKKYRRRGIGEALACHAFADLPGYWEVGQMADNPAAQAFWRRVIGAYTGGAYAERRLTDGWWQGVVQSFNSGGAR